MSESSSRSGSISEHGFMTLWVADPVTMKAPPTATLAALAQPHEEACLDQMRMASRTSPREQANVQRLTFSLRTATARIIVGLAAPRFVGLKLGTGPAPWGMTFAEAARRQGSKPCQVLRQLAPRRPQFLSP
jgi:hypothetical protein